MSPAYPAFSLISFPHPPTPLPGGKGEIFCFLMQGASPLASPGLNPGDTGSTLRNRFFWCRRRTPVAVNKNSRKVLGGLGASFKKPPSASPPLASPGAEPGRHWLDFKKPILFGVVGERRLQSIKIREKFLGVWGLLSRSSQRFSNASPTLQQAQKIRCSIYKGVRKWYTIGETSR